MPGRFRAVFLWGVIVATLLLLARGLPPRTFYVGDPGVKLIAARNAIEHPTRPLEIDLPQIGGLRVDLVDPFFRVRGDHALATTSALFPLVSAPLVAVFGTRGAFVLPAFSLLLAIAGVAKAGAALDERRSRTMLGFVVIACTPLLFYALEFWEHAPAVGVAAFATYLFVRRRSGLGLFACGLLLGLAVLLRPEAAWYGVALLVSAPRLPSRLTVRQVVIVLAGVAVVCLPAVAASAILSGEPFGGHVMTNMSGIMRGWWSNRMAILRVWFVPQQVAWLAAYVLLSLTAAAAGANRSGSKVVYGAVVMFVAVAAVAAARRVFELPSLWNAAPAALLSFAIPIDGGRNGRNFLVAVSVVSSLLVVLTAPNDGGGQWGPRYLLFAFIPLAILTADALAAAVRSSRFLGPVAVAVIVASSLLVERNAYKELKAAKRTYEQIVEFVEHETPPGSYLVTDLWWLDQVIAGVYPTRVVLYVDSAASAQRALGLLATAPTVFVVRSEVDSPDDGFERWREGTAFVVGRRAAIEERSLTLFRLDNLH